MVMKKFIFVCGFSGCIVVLCNNVLNYVFVCCFLVNGEYLLQHQPQGLASYNVHYKCIGSVIFYLYYNMSQGLIG